MIDDKQREQLDLLASLIAESPHNLVSRGNRELVADQHIPECLQLARILNPGDGTHWIDLGTGGGLPGLVLAIMFPNTGWTLIDSIAKKVNAVNDFIDELDLENARGVCGRAEELAREDDFRQRYHGVVSRAVARLDVVTELSRGFVRPNGRIVVMKGPMLERERGYCQKASGHLKVFEKGTQQLRCDDRESYVVTLIAKGPVPIMIPRAVGVPNANPLGGPKS